MAHDNYGDGTLLHDVERKVADLPGFQAGVFCISGTMTQVTALRLACLQRASRLVALHPICRSGAKGRCSCANGLRGAE